jgi:glycosyltransferase involved in cell wall biosynthesis
MDCGKGLVTISIPTFRRPSLLLHTLHSCFIQDYRPLEIDIGDDSPGSETEELIKAVSAPEGISVRYRQNRPGLGQAGNVNKLFGAARGPRLVLLHDDDVLVPGAISALSDGYSSANDIIAAYGIQEVISESGEISAQETAANNELAKRVPLYSGIQTQPVVCALWRQFPNDGYLIDSRIARRIGYRGISEVGNANDADFAIRLAIEHRNLKFLFLNRVTSQYRLSTGSIRAMNDTCRRIYEVIQALDLIGPEERDAREQLLEHIAEEAVVDNALRAERRAALRVLLSKHYRRMKDPIKTAFHLAIILIPQLYYIRVLAGTAKMKGFLLR